MERRESAEGTFIGLKWPSRSGIFSCIHLLLRERQNYNLLLNIYRQETVGYHQKKIPHVEGQRRRSNKMVGGAKSHLESNPIPARDARRPQTKLCVHQDPEAPQRLSQTCLSVFECLLPRHGSAVVCHRDRNSGCSRPGTCSVWHSPLGGSCH